MAARPDEARRSGTRRAAPSIPEMAERILAGSRTDLARAITLVESARADHRRQARELLSLLMPHTGRAVRVGISGVPGAGKSTTIDTLGVRLIDRGHKVAVLAVDPSSSRTGGSILGDRTRMAALTAHPDAYVRPSPSGLHLGGVARATRESMVLVEAAGFDVVLVETVGVGQSEVAVSEMVDTFLLIALARSGDQLQGIKRGILEMADVITVNKADGENVMAARSAARELQIAMKLVRPPEEPRVPVLTCSAHTGDGIDEVWEAVLEHRAHLEERGLEAHRSRQQISWMWSMVENELLGALSSSSAVAALRPEVESAVGSHELSAVDGASRILTTLAPELERVLRGEDSGG